VVPPGAALDLHQMAKLFIVIGVLLIAGATFARWFSGTNAADEEVTFTVRANPAGREFCMLSVEAR
jgi:hypothetical protein